jgi:hypothetical protein
MLNLNIQPPVSRPHSLHGASRQRYDAGVKKPVAVPNNRNVPSGAVCVTSKLQVTTSPCRLCLDSVEVSVCVGPPVGVNWKVRSRVSGTKTAGGRGRGQREW